MVRYYYPTQNFGEKEIKNRINIMKLKFKTGDEIEYAYGLKYTFLAIDPFDETEAYCIHPTEIDQRQPNLKYKRVDKLPLNRLTPYKDISNIRRTLLG